MLITQIPQRSGVHIDNLHASARQATKTRPTSIVEDENDLQWRVHDSSLIISVRKYLRAKSVAGKAGKGSKPSQKLKGRSTHCFSFRAIALEALWGQQPVPMWQACGTCTRS